MHSLSITGLMFLAVAVVTNAADGPSWPRFHGPHGDNRSRETGLLESWPERGPRRLWTVKGIGQGYSSVSVADGRIYASGNLRGKTAISALDLEGNILWQVPGGEAWRGPYPGTRGTPTVDGGCVYHESPLGQIVCLDAKTGREIWSLNILAECEADNITWALSESLLVDGDRVICCPGGPHASIVALDKTTGTTIWTAESTGDPAGYATPIVAEHAGLRIILTMNQGALIGVNAASGKLLFRYPHETRHGANVTSPIFHGGHIFITSGYQSGSEMLKLTVDGPAASVEPVWESKDLDNLLGGVVLVGGHLYGAAHQAKRTRRTPWVCLDWQTGTRSHAAKGIGRGSLTWADGMFYLLGQGGCVALVQAGPDSHQVVSQFSLPKEEKGPTWAHPVVAGGCLYLRHGDRLHAYDVRRE